MARGAAVPCSAGMARRVAVIIEHRVTSSHSPHHGGRVDRARGRGSSAGDSRAASTAYGFRTPAVFVPTIDANACGAPTVSSAASTAGMSLAR